MKTGIASMSAVAHSGRYWLALLVVGIAFELVALYYQYALDEPPCLLCIHARLWVAALITLSAVMLVLHRLAPIGIAGHVLTAIIAAGLLHTSWQLLGTERGFIIGACGFDLGLPSWLTPDLWFPALFEVQTTCGYTPVLLLGITMAEFLLVASALLVMTGLLMTLMSVLRSR